MNKWFFKIERFLIKNQYILKFLFFLFLIFFISIIIVPTNLQTQLYFSLSLFIISFILTRFQTDKNKEYIKLFLIFSMLLIALRYFYWRTVNTLNFDNFFNAAGSLILYFAEIYSFIVALLGFFVALRLLDRKPIPLSIFKREELPSVDIFIPTYNEPLEIIRTTAVAASVMDYPKDKFNVYILDDGGTDQKINDPNPQKAKEAKKRRKSLMQLAKEIGDNVHYITREKNLHAKAGNINEALKKTQGDLILILDCDHVPSQDFLRNVVGFFMKYPKVFLVQTPHKFINPDPIEKNLRIFRKVPSENEMFYSFIQKGLDFWSASFFCGSAAVLRRKYLEEIGGISGSTITEDAETALGLHAKGYDSIYYSKGMVFGLQPETFSSFIIQRSRWASGMIQIFLLKNPLKFKNLKWYQKLSYLNSNFFWFFPFARTVFIISPMFFIIFGLKVYDANIKEVVVYPLIYFLYSVFISSYLYSKYRLPFFSEVYETAQSLFILPDIIATLKNPTAPEFKVTPKGEEVGKDFVSPFYKPIFILFHLMVIILIIGIIRFILFPEERGTLLILFGWIIFNLLVLGLGIIIAYERAEKRRAFRIPAKEDAIIYVEDEPIKGKVRDISLTGIWISTDVDLTDKLDKIRDNILLFYIKDTRGILFLVKGKVVNANAHNIRMQFIYESIETERKIIEIVYAPSSRWEYFYDTKEMTPIESLFFLTKLLLQDFKISYKKELEKFLLELKQWFRKINITKIKKGESNGII